MDTRQGMWTIKKKTVKTIGIVSLIIFIVVMMTGCWMIPYRYNNDLSASENAHYRQVHYENSVRASQNFSNSMRNWSNDMQRNERLRKQPRGGQNCRWVGEWWRCQ